MYEVRIHGRGGQGVVTAAELLSVAAWVLLNSRLTWEQLHRRAIAVHRTHTLTVHCGTAAVQSATRAAAREMLSRRRPPRAGRIGTVRPIGAIRLSRTVTSRMPPS